MGECGAGRACARVPLHAGRAARAAADQLGEELEYDLRRSFLEALVDAIPAESAVNEEEIRLGISFQLNGRPRFAKEGEGGWIASDPRYLNGTMIAEPALREELLYRQHVGRMTAAISHPGPPWEPLLELAALSMPWTPLWLVLAYRTLRSREVRAEDPGLRRAVAWVVVLLVFFSVIAEKRNVYLLPAYPAVALLAARALTRMTADREDRVLRRAAAVAPALLTIVGLAACFAFLATPAVIRKMPEATGIGLRGLGLGLPVAALGWSALRALRSGRVDAYATRLAGTMAVLALGVGFLIYPLVDVRKSAEGLARILAARPETPASIPCYGVQPEGYRFYSGRPTVGDATGELVARAAADLEEPFLALVTEARFDELPEATRAAVEVAHREQVGSRSVLLLTRR